MGAIGAAEIVPVDMAGNVADPAPAGMRPSSEWRFHVFGDAGVLGIYDALPSQQQHYNFASIGAGTRLKVLNHYNGSLDVAMPLVDQPDAQRGEVRVIFRGWADF